MTILQRSSKILIQDSADVVKQFPMFGKGEPLYLWAENGLVRWEYAETNGYGTMAWDDAAHRVLALSEMITRSGEDGDYADERIALQRFVAAMENVIRKAKDQGSPFNPDAGKDRKARRSVSVAPRPVSAVDPFPELFSENTSNIIEGKDA